MVEEVDHRGAFGGAADNPPNPRWTLPKTISISQFIRTKAINLSVLEFHHQLHEKVGKNETHKTKPKKSYTRSKIFIKKIFDF